MLFFSLPIYILEMTHSTLGSLFWLIYQVSQKTANFLLGLEQEKAFQQVNAAIRLALPLRPHDRVESMHLSCPLQIGLLLGAWTGPY